MQILVPECYSKTLLYYRNGPTMAGHSETKKMYGVLSKTYYWPQTAFRCTWIRAHVRVFQTTQAFTKAQTTIPIIYITWTFRACRQRHLSLANNYKTKKQVHYYKDAYLEIINTDYHRTKDNGTACSHSGSWKLDYVIRHITDPNDEQRFAFCVKHLCCTMCN